MPVLTALHQLFPTDPCVVYIHTLRWQDRLLHCPRCHSQKVGPWGPYHYRPGLKRYHCKACRRTFNALTQTLFAQSQRSLAPWILAPFLVCLSCSSRRLARELGVHRSTSSRWCWRLRNAAFLRDAAPGGGHGRSRCTLSHRWAEGTSHTWRKKAPGTPSMWAPQAARPGSGL
jgi:transposase-like protein